jgi:hypothetical protein
MYRVNSASVEVMPVQGGSLYSSGPMLYANDPVGSFDTTNAVVGTTATKLLESI